MLDEQRPSANQDGRQQLPQRNVEALRRRLGHRVPRADLQVVDLGEEVVQETRVLAHCALRLSGGAGGEVDVRELFGRDFNSEIALGMAPVVCRFDKECLNSGQRCESLTKRGGAAAFSEHEPTVGPGKCPGDAVGREMRLDG